MGEGRKVSRVASFLATAIPIVWHSFVWWLCGPTAALLSAVYAIGTIAFILWEIGAKIRETTGGHNAD